MSNTGPTRRYEIQLAPGQHRLEALAWSIGPYAPVAQLSWRGGFVLKAEDAYDKQLTTGKAPWEVARLDGFEFTPGIFFVGAQLTAHGCGPQWKEGNYVKAQVIRSPIKKNPYGESAPGWKLFPTTLPDQFDREVNAGHAVALGSGALGKDDTVRAGAGAASRPAEMAVARRGPGRDRGAGQPRASSCSGTSRITYCAYPLCEVSGGAGAKLAWSWAESLYLPNSQAKGNRGEFIGKNFRGMTDTFLPEGGAHRNFPRSGGARAAGA